MAQSDALAINSADVRSLIASGILPSDFVNLPSSEASFWLEAASDDLEAQKARIEDGIRALKLKLNRHRANALPVSTTPRREFKKCRKVNTPRF